MLGSVILNRIGGNLGIGAATLGNIFGLLYDDAETVLSFSFQGGCQFQADLSNNFPRTTPRFEQFIPAGRSGWMKLTSPTNQAMFGAMLNSNPNAGSRANAFVNGHNLHILTLSPTATLIIPVFPPSC